MMNAHRKALLIGVEMYTHLRHVVGARDDCELLGSWLRQQGGFDVEILPEIHQKQGGLNSKIRSYLSHGSSDDVLIVLFAGHGQAHDGQLYLIPADAWGHEQGIPVSDLLNWGSGAGFLVILLDTCFAGAIPSSLVRSPSGSVAVLCSTDDLSVSRAVEDRGPLVSAMLEALKPIGEQLADEAYEIVTTLVRAHLRLTRKGLSSRLYLSVSGGRGRLRSFSASPQVLIVKPDAALQERPYKGLPVDLHLDVHGLSCDLLLAIRDHCFVELRENGPLRLLAAAFIHTMEIHRHGDFLRLEGRNLKAMPSFIGSGRDHSPTAPVESTRRCSYRLRSEGNIPMSKMTGTIEHLHIVPAQDFLRITVSGLRTNEPHTVAILRWH